MRLKKGDKIKVLSGKDRGKSGKILAILNKESKVLLDGLNVYKKHKRGRRQGEKGEVVLVPRPLAASKVVLICPSCNRAARSGFRFEGDKKVRFCRKCQAVI